MIIRTPQDEITAYFNNEEYVSQSKLKRLLQGTDVFNSQDKTDDDLYYEEKSHFINGSAVDTLLTQTQAEFDKQYHISMAKKPSGKGLSVIHLVFDNMVNVFEGQEINRLNLNMVADEDILTACNYENFNKNHKDATRVATIRKLEDYFNELCISYGKQILDPEEFITINMIVDSLKTNPLTKKYFPTDTPKGIDIYYQYPIYFEENGIKCKALLDIVYVDTLNQIVYLIDLKTTGDYTIKFIDNAMKFRYDFQAAWYYNAFTKVEKFKKYAIDSFSFIVESTKVQGNPLMFFTESSFMNMGKNGRPELITTGIDSTGGDHYMNIKAIHGWKYALELYNWHMQNGFDKDRIIVKNQGMINLGWNKIS